MPSLTVPVYRGFPVYTLASDRDVEVSTLLIPFADLYCYTLVLVRALQVNWGLGLAGKRAAAEHQCIPLVGLSQSWGFKLRGVHNPALVR